MFYRIVPGRPLQEDEISHDPLDQIEYGDEITPESGSYSDTDIPLTDEILEAAFRFGRCGDGCIYLSPNAVRAVNGRRTVRESYDTAIALHERAGKPMSEESHESYRGFIDQADATFADIMSYPVNEDVRAYWEEISRL